MCCRLAAQPNCMTQRMMSGWLKVRVSWQVCAPAPLMWCIPPGFSLAAGFVSDSRLPLPPPQCASSSPSHVGLSLCFFCVTLFFCFPRSSVEVTLRAGPKSSLFSKEQACSATIAKRMWRQTLSLSSLSELTRWAEKRGETKENGGFVHTTLLAVYFWQSQRRYQHWCFWFAASLLLKPSVGIWFKNLGI